MLMLVLVFMLVFGVGVNLCVGVGVDIDFRVRVDAYVRQHLQPRYLVTLASTKPSNTPQETPSPEHGAG